MAKLTITRGVSGSGKSTWAEAQAGNPVIVSRDRLRVACFGSDGPDYYNVPKDVLRAKEDFITKGEHATIEAALRAGFDVISDNTNIQMRYVNPLASIARKVGADVEFKVFDISLFAALQRNAARAANGGRNVPEDAIKKQYEQFQSSKKHDLVLPPVPAPYNGTPGKPKAFLVDVDGTLAHMKDHRGPFDWKNVGKDEVDEVIAAIVQRLYFGTTFNEEDGMLTCIVMSGRDESCRTETGFWLNEAEIPFNELFMRPEGDMRKDNIVKAELFDEHVRDNYDVQFVLDDRQQVVDMWRSMGITCLQVAPGDF